MEICLQVGETEDWIEDQSGVKIAFLTDPHRFRQIKLSRVSSTMSSQKDPYAHLTLPA